MLILFSPYYDLRNPYGISPDYWPIQPDSSLFGVITLQAFAG